LVTSCLGQKEEKWVTKIDTKSGQPFKQLVQNRMFGIIFALKSNPTRKPMHKNLLKTSLAVAVLAQMALPVLAADQPQKLKEVVVRDVPIEQDILPTSRPFSSVYGTDLSIMDTPRNVTIISREQLSAIDIQNVRDFTKLTTSSYTGNNFGAPTTPNIRGQIADSYINGMRKGLTSNGNGLPINFNSIESVNIIKGPGSVVQGDTQYTGGAVDFVT
jgi:outer membrane receptor protein involved in Fe transport